MAPTSIAPGASVVASALLCRHLYRQRDMSRQTFFTTTTVLPPGVTRETVLEALHDHLGMVQCLPNNCSITPCRAPSFATPEESTKSWYLITDRISYLPGFSSMVPYHGCFNNLFDGMQSHVYATLGLDIKN